MDVAVCCFVFCGLIGFSWGDTFSVVIIYIHVCGVCLQIYVYIHAISIFLVPGCSRNSHLSTSEQICTAPKTHMRFGTDWDHTCPSPRSTTKSLTFEDWLLGRKQGFATFICEGIRRINDSCRFCWSLGISNLNHSISRLEVCGYDFQVSSDVLLFRIQSLGISIWPSWDFGQPNNRRNPSNFDAWEMAWCFFDPSTGSTVLTRPFKLQWFLEAITWVVPPPSNSHHQDYYIFSMESL